MSYRRSINRGGKLGKNEQWKARLKQACLERIKNRRAEIILQSRRSQAFDINPLNTKTIVHQVFEEEGISESDMFILLQEMEGDIRREG